MVMSLPLQDIKFLKSLPKSHVALRIRYQLSPTEEIMETHIFSTNDGTKIMAYAFCVPRRGLLSKLKRRKSGIKLIDDQVPKEFEVEYYTCSAVFPRIGIAFKSRYPLTERGRIMVNALGDNERLSISYGRLPFIDKEVKEDINLAIFPLQDLKSGVDFIFRSVSIWMEGPIEENLEKILLQLNQVEGVLGKIEEEYVRSLKGKSSKHR